MWRGYRIYHESAIRLSKLNQALLLLAKIENGQFYETERLDLREVVSNKLAEMEEIFQLNGADRNVSQCLIIPGRHALRYWPKYWLPTCSIMLAKHNLHEAGTIEICRKFRTAWW